MRLCPTSILIVVQILSLSNGEGIFQNLSIASECFPPKLSDSNYPTCTFLVPLNAVGRFTSECIRKKNASVPALRIVGEFRILKITCTASFPIDFRYYGIQPTEAIFINWYKDVLPNTKRAQQKFTVEVKVNSVQKLFEYYNKAKNSYYDRSEGILPLDTVHDYSRTGSYEFRGIFNKNLGTSFYLFLEDEAKPSFLRNQKTVPKIIGNYFIIPCVSSHFEAVVELAKIPSTLSRAHFSKSHIDGFIFQSDGIGFESYYGNYQCVLKYKGEVADVIDFEFHNNSTATEKLFGLEAFNFEEGDDLDVSGESVLQGEYIKFVRPLCKTRSPHDHVDIAKVKILSVPIHNFGYMRLVQQFAIPKYFNRSYTARMANNVTVGWDTLQREIKQSIGTSLRMGTVYCTTGYSRNIMDYGVSIRGIVKTFDYGEDWATFDRRSNDIKVHFGLDILNEFRPMYAGMIIAFVCRVNIAVVVKPIVWYTERVDGTRKQEKIDYDLVVDTATWNANLSVDVTKVICSASYWYSDWWREISISFTLQEITKPVIDKTETTKTFQFGAEGVTLECLAWGNPKPKVYFGRQGLRLYSLESSGGTVIIFNKIDPSNTGKYTCVASNGYETRQDFFIKVKHPDFDILIIVIPLLVFFVTVMAAVIYIKFFRREKRGLTQEEVIEFLKGMPKEQIPENDLNHAHGFASMLSYNIEYEIARERFVVDHYKVLGIVEFGMVTKGKVDNKSVAVKAIKKHAQKQYLMALLSELKILIYLGHHPNLVQIVGAYTKDLKKGIAYIFLEYVPLGSLESYLRNNKDQFLTKKTERTLNGYTTWGYTHTTVLTLENLFDWSKQIANGMEYLGSRKVIHGDISTRNVLLDENLNAKITDFGLAKKLYHYQEYIKKDKEPLPWRWLAIESLTFLTFSTASDIWAFGITLWEIFTLGEVPYPGYTWNKDFVKELQNGMRMEKPRYASDQLFLIISQCWREDPKERPSFQVLKQWLADLVQLDFTDSSEDETVL